MLFLQELNIDWMRLLNFNERPFRAKFIPSKIWKDLDKYKNDKRGLTNYVKKWRTKIEWCEQKSKAKMYETHLAVGGEYDAENRQCSLLIYVKKDYNSFTFTDETWNRFKHRLIQTLMHELIHFMQYDRRGDEWSGYVVPYKKVKSSRKNEERQYLSEFDEIQAYAHCVLLDYKMFKPTIPVTELLTRCKKKRDSSTLHYILKTFDYDFRNNEAIPKIIKQIAKWDRKYEKAMRPCRKPK
jgi:hypothetical protein